jgi:hypothetical protein
LFFECSASKNVLFERIENSDPAPRYNQLVRKSGWEAS